MLTIYSVSLLYKDCFVNLLTSTVAMTY